MESGARLVQVWTGFIYEGPFIVKKSVNTFKRNMEHLFTSESIISFIILVILEVVLGIDNVIFVSIILNRLKTAREHSRGRIIWMITGIISRSLLLMGLGWLLTQKGKAIFHISGKGFDLASLVMLLGGLFLIYKSVRRSMRNWKGKTLMYRRGNQIIFHWVRRLARFC